MYVEIPQYCLRAFALFFSRFGTAKQFTQSELEWVVSESMRKKIFALLLRSNWIRKRSRNTYACNNPSEIFSHLLDFRVPEIMKTSKKEYCFTSLSAIEIWSDYSYMQRDIKRSPYFIKILKKDLPHWKTFFSKEEIPSYLKEGTTIGEFVILIPVDKISKVEVEGLFVDSLEETIKQAKENELYAYAYNYMVKKYGKTPTARG